MNVDIDTAIRLLNEALAADRDAMEKLISNRVNCNEVLAKHPTIQVKAFAEKGSSYGKSEVTGPLIRYSVGMLGIINGIFGADENENGFIAARFDDETHQLVAFERHRG